jgi:hypothetical protein
MPTAKNQHPPVWIDIAFLVFEKIKENGRKFEK